MQDICSNLLDKCYINVIVPVYNAEDYLNTCIQSILTQTFEGFELLLINDGSTDASLSICEHYLYDKRVRLINQNNNGVSAARNSGIKFAKAEWIMFVDADDEIESDLLSIMYDASRRHSKVDFMICGHKTYLFDIADESMSTC